MKATTNQVEAGRRVSDDELWLETVRRQVSSLEYGIVQIVVHGARVVQIERTEKVRITNPLPS